MNIPDLPDRRWIEREYLPSLRGRVLYVGMDFYTAHYPELATGATEFVFLDRGDSAERHPHLGVVHCDFLDYRPTAPFDHISLYGLVGFGTPESVVPDQIAHADAMLRGGGTLMIGPNKRLPEKLLPKDWRARIDEAPDWMLGVLLAKPAEHWRELFSRPPLDRYKVIVDDVPGVASNYIWWGRKGGG